MKKCSKCKGYKPISEFYKCKSKSDGLQSHCKSCSKIIDTKRIVSGENRLRCKEKYHGKLKYNIAYKVKENERRRVIHKQRLKNDIVYRIKNYTSCFVNVTLRNRSVKKTHSFWKVVGYTPQDLINHLQSLFKDGMCWENRKDWHIDHIIPQSKFMFNSITDEEFKKCWALKNLQPLWAIDNIKKGNKLSVV